MKHYGAPRNSLKLNFKLFTKLTINVLKCPFFVHPYFLQIFLKQINLAQGKG